MAIVPRGRDGRFVKGFSGNPSGRLPRNTETQYLETTMEQCSIAQWAEIVARAVQDALSDNDANVRARAREWLGKYVIGEPSQLHQILYREEKDFQIVVTFGEEAPRMLEDEIIEGEIAAIEE